MFKKISNIMKFMNLTKLAKCFFHYKHCFRPFLRNNYEDYKKHEDSHTW
jgi:hypothetical protein